MNEARAIEVRVVYSLPPQPPQVRLRLPADATIRDAVESSGLLDRFPEIDLGVNPVGVFGRRRGLSETLRDGDRVEIYRPLSVDPKDSRRRRVARGRAASTSG